MASFLQPASPSPLISVLFFLYSPENTTSQLTALSQPCFASGSHTYFYPSPLDPCPVSSLPLLEPFQCYMLQQYMHRMLHIHLRVRCGEPIDSAVLIRIRWNSAHASIPRDHAMERSRQWLRPACHSVKAPSAAY
ncbi:hypothetical protein GGI43DRAFT_342384 [Trichoderma evansii]